VKIANPLKMNIRTRILVLCFAVAAPLLTIGTFFLLNEYKALKTEAQRATLIEAQSSTRLLSNFLNNQLFALESLASLLEQTSSGSKTTASANTLLKGALHSQPQWHALIFIDQKKQISLSATTQNNRLPGHLLNLVKTTPPIALKAKAKFSPQLVKDSSGNLFLAAWAPNKQGTLLLLLKPESLMEVLQEPKPQNDSVFLVVDADQRVIVRTKDNQNFKGKNFSRANGIQAALKKEHGIIEAKSIADAIARVYAFDHVPATNWTVVVGLPTSQIYRMANNWLVIMLLLTLSAIGLSVLLAWAATNHFTKAIHKLVKEAISIGKGNFSSRVDVQNSDELGLLARAFNEMARALELDREQNVMVNRITDSVRQSLDIEEILNTTVKELGTNLKASRACLAIIGNQHPTTLKGEGKGELSFDYVWFNQDFSGTPLKNSKVAIGKQTVLGRIIDQGSTVWLDVINDEQTQDLFAEASETTSDWPSIKSLIASPIKTNTGTIGLILVHQCDHLRVWSHRELELVEAVSAQVSMALEQGRLYTQAKSLAEQEQLINQVVRSMRSSLELDTILDTVTIELSKALSADAVHIALPRSEGPLIVSHEYKNEALPSTKGLSLYSFDLNFHPSENFHPGDSALVPSDSCILGIDIANLKRGTELQSFSAGENLGHLSVIEDADNDSRCHNFKDYLKLTKSKSLIAAPLMNEDQILGVLVVHICERERTFRQEELRLVCAVADQLSVAIAHAQLFAQVKHQAITDGLTGLYNHVYFKNRLQEELKLAERKGTAVSLIMIDLDKLKFINDTYGHPIGDAAIRQISIILKTLLRSGDTAARYGGEEFGIILPETSLLEAALIADRLCSQIRNSQVPNLGKITASLGTACYPHQAKSSAELIEKADKALYFAKNNGRDQIKVFEEGSVPQGKPSFKNVTRENIITQEILK
jgi:diguanylate cyclase (GGDEF)-like protein